MINLGEIKLENTLFGGGISRSRFGFHQGVSISKSEPSGLHGRKESGYNEEQTTEKNKHFSMFPFSP